MWKIRIALKRKAGIASALKYNFHADTTPQILVCKMNEAFSVDVQYIQSIVCQENLVTLQDYVLQYYFIDFFKSANKSHQKECMFQLWLAV